MKKIISIATIFTMIFLVGCDSDNILMESHSQQVLDTSQKEEAENLEEMNEKGKIKKLEDLEEIGELEKIEGVEEIEEIEEIEKRDKTEEIDNTQEIGNIEETEKKEEKEGLGEVEKLNPNVMNNKEVKEEETKHIKKSSLSNELKSWWFIRNNENLPPGAQNEIDIAYYDAYYLGNINEKKIYLTFDEGYENGYTGKILDTLKEHNVKATFFVTKPYIESQPELIKRMVDEGHIVGNHTVTHPSLPSKSKEEIEYEINDTAGYYKEVTGRPMDLFFRPPSGEYSERTLQITKDLGYKTIFWSMAYNDWDINHQPGKQVAYNHIVNNHHQGAIILLHAVSSSNTEALPDIINFLKEQGYTFALLNEIN